MMKVLATLVLLSGSAMAFTPSTTTSNSRNVVTSLYAEKSQSLPFMNRPALLDGTMAGDFGFDPLGLSESDGVGVDLYWLREAELKNARVAMLAAAGFIFVELFGPAPGCEMATSKNQIDAFWELYAVHPQYIWAAFIFIGFIELVSGIACTTGRESGKREPGDFGLDPFKCKGTAKWDKYALQEIQNGRLAMWAAAGEILQGCTTSDGAIGNLLG